MQLNTTKAGAELHRIEQDLDAVLRSMVSGDLGVLPTPDRDVRRSAVRRLGARAFELVGDVDALLEVAERCCDLDQPNWGRRMSILNSAWDGLGDESGRWWA